MPFDEFLSAQLPDPLRLGGDEVYATMDGPVSFDVAIQMQRLSLRMPNPNMKRYWQPLGTL